jgi:hypothetical protein
MFDLAKISYKKSPDKSFGSVGAFKVLLLFSPNKLLAHYYILLFASV